jgi:hypothetical protein
VFRFPSGARDLSLLQNMKTGSGAYKIFYVMRTAGSYPGDKAVGT